MKRRLLSIVLSLCMVFMLMPQMVFAESSGDFSYTVSDGKVTITGYTGSGGAVVIPGTINDNPVTAIGNATFIEKNIESVTIPSSVTSIGSQAFYNCYSLSSVTFGQDSQLTSIGTYAFQNCRSLASITIPSGVTSIEEHVFYDCTNLASIDIPDSVTTIGDAAFAKCTSLAKVAFGDNSKLTSIGIQAFNVCRSLESIKIPSSVTTIKEQAFSYCSGLESIEIPGSVTSIGDSAFARCTSLDSIFLPKDLDVTRTAIPETASQVRYSLDADKSEVTITEITLGTDKTSVTIPETICGYPVVAVAASEQSKVGEHTCRGGTATCTDKALCSICGEKYGNLLDHNLENIPAKDATLNEEGNIEYWHCLTCGRLFADENGEKEISLADTVIPKLTPETDGDKDQSTKADAEDSAKTGDDTNLALWLALMILAGAGIAGTTIYTRRKRTNE